MGERGEGGGSGGGEEREGGRRSGSRLGGERDESVEREVREVLRRELGGALALGRLVGKGTYGRVWEATRASGGKVAVKAMRPGHLRRAYAEKFLPRELEILWALRGNTSGLLSAEAVVGRGGATVVVVSELAEGGDLLAYIRSVVTVPQRPASFLLRQLVEALAFLHAHHLVHRDLKLENVLLTWDGNARLADLGFARRQGPEDGLSRTFCGSAAYAAPELLRQQPYLGSAADLWSLGVIFYTLLSGLMPFDDRDVPRMVQRQLSHRVRFSRSAPSVSREAKDAVHALLSPAPEDRPSAVQLAHGPFLCNVPFHPRIPQPDILSGFPIGRPIVPDDLPITHSTDSHSLHAPVPTHDIPLA